jgi:predicted ATPase/DNA-binding SARP family transcriptional activator
MPDSACVEFRVLGPLQVAADAGPVELAPGKQIGLLACLLVARGAVVSRDRLIDALWGERPPASAVNALQVLVHGLRRRLGPDRIQREGPGYRLRLEPGELDAERFERLAGRGRDELGGEAAGTAAASLREALGLWRGPAYEDVRYEAFAQAEATRLDELRLAALEDRIDADLALGRHQELVAELEALVAEHRARERLFGQLMLALYRSGRQAEALDAFRRGRRDLLDELGLEPGAELQALQRAILDQDPALAVEPADARARRNLPAAATAIVGREAELADLAGLLRGGARLITLTGPGGIGKTRLALQAAHDLAETVADGAHFVDLAHVTDPGLVPDAIAAALAVPAQRDEPPTAALRRFLGPRRALVVLDNFEVVDAAAPLVADLLRAAPGLAVLATSRTPLRLTGEHQLRVEPLPLPDAVRLFAARSRAVAPGFRRPGEETDEVARLCRRLDCLPLAIELAAARTRDYAPRELLESMPSSLELAGEGARDLPARQRTLRAAIDWSHRLLAPDEQATFARLGVFAGGFAAESAAAVAGAGREELASLVRASLVAERPGPGGDPRWALLEVVREYALERLQQLGERDQRRKVHAEHYAALAEAVEDEYPASRSGADWRRLEAEHDNFRAALDWTSAAAAPELQLRLVAALAYFWTTSDHLREGRARIDAALREADGAPAPLRAKALAGAALVAHSLGDYDRMRGFAQEALDRFGALDDERGTALALNLLGIALSNLGDLDGGIACHERNAEISRRLGDGVRLSAALNNLGYCLLRRGRGERARPLFEEGLAVSRRIGHRTGESVMLGNLGLAALLDEHPRQALESFRLALRIDRELGYAEGQIYGLVNVAAALSALDGAADAAVLLGAARAGARATAVEFEPLELEVQAQAAQRLTRALDAEQLARADADGRALGLEAAVERALGAAQVSA